MGKGFTIIELLIVIFIIGLLVLVVATSIKPFQCERYRSAPVGTIPNECVEYLIGE